MRRKRFHLFRIRCLRLRPKAQQHGMLNCNLPPGFTTRRSLGLAILLSHALFALDGFADVTFTAVAPFRGTNGAQPFGTLVRGTNGLFYGTTARGGDFDSSVGFQATTSRGNKPPRFFD